MSISGITPEKPHGLCRYQRMLDVGKYRSIGEMAAAEKLDRGYLGRLLQLTLLAPDLIQAIVDGREPAGVTLTVLMGAFPAVWGLQHAVLAGA